MKKILLMSITALGVSAISSWANPNAFSQNVVGYVNTVLPGGDSHINAPFWSGTNTVEAVMPTIKKGDSVSLWNGVNFTTLTYAGTNFDGQGHAWADSQGVGQDSPAINPGRAFVYKNNGGAITNTFTGTIPMAASTTIPGHHTYSMLVSAIPISGTLDSPGLSLPFQVGDKVFIWFGNHYMSYTYEGVNFDGQGHAFANDNSQGVPAPFIRVGQAFFYQNNQDSAETWKQSIQLP